MRALVQPGPVHPRRIDSFAAEARRLAFVAAPGGSLLEALTAPLVAAGFQAAVLRFSGAAVAPFRYVMPNHAPDASHVAYFSAPWEPEGVTRIERASATFGWHNGQPFLHCHAVWIEADGQRRGGHILNDETVLISGVAVEAWGFEALRIETAEDAETNFTLFQPSWVERRGVGGRDAFPSPSPSRRRDGGTNAVLARVRPNEDICHAIETLARTHGMSDASIVGSVGSLVGTRFDDGRDVPDRATEVLVTHGAVREGVATLDLLSVDMEGHVHEGRIARGENPVCITFDLVLVAGSRSREKQG